MTEGRMMERAREFLARWSVDPKGLVSPSFGGVAKLWEDEIATLLQSVRDEAIQGVKPVFIPPDWRTMDAKDCCDNLYVIGGALRSMQKHALAIRVEKVANALYPGEIKPLPIIPRSTSG